MFLYQALTVFVSIQLLVGTTTMALVPCMHTLGNVLNEQVSRLGKLRAAGLGATRAEAIDEMREKAEPFAATRHGQNVLGI
jgi:hypothetical protein